MQFKNVSRRRVVAGGAAAAGLVAAPFVRSANAAGSLTIGLWDHWVPGANDVQSAIIKEWADKEKVDVKVDYITSQGNKLLLTLAVEAQAKSGHDIMEFTNWESAQHGAALEPVNDVVARVLAKNGPVDPAVEYLGKIDGKWLGVPMTRGTLLLGTCSRFDMMKEYGGVDVQALYPAGKPPNDASWTWDSFLTAAEKCQKAGFGFGLPLGNTTDTNQWVGSFFIRGENNRMIGFVETVNAFSLYLHLFMLPLMFYFLLSAKYSQNKELILLIYAVFVIQTLVSGISTGQDDRLTVTGIPLWIVSYLLVIYSVFSTRQSTVLPD